MVTIQEMVDALHLNKSADIKAFKTRLSSQNESDLFRITEKCLEEGQIALAARGYDYLLHLNCLRLDKFTSLIDGQIQSYIIQERDVTIILPHELTLLSENLGTGGFSQVVKGRWAEKAVAIKKMNVSDNPLKELKNFIKETKSHALLQDHPNIVKLLGIHVVQKQLYFIQELVKDGSLERITRSENYSVNLKLIHQVVKAVASALNHIHKLQYMHNDVKPGNILCDGHHIKLTDFGCSTPISSPNNAGTPIYFPQEVYTNVHLRNELADIHALGLVMWEMFTRTFPFYHKFNTIERHKQLDYIIDYIREGNTEDVPENAPPSYQKIMSLCWSKVESRPNAEKIMQELEQIAPAESSYTFARTGTFFQSISQQLRGVCHPKERSSLLTTNPKNGPSGCEKIESLQVSQLR